MSVLLQDFIPALYQCLGMSVGAEFSTKDVSLLFCKVFHVSSNRSEAEAAMRKVKIDIYSVINFKWQQCFYSFVPKETLGRILKIITESLTL